MSVDALQWWKHVTLDGNEPTPFDLFRKKLIKYFEPLSRDLKALENYVNFIKLVRLIP